MLNITKNLVIESIEATNWKHDDREREITTCWGVFFTFRGIGGFSAMITDEGINHPLESFQIVESHEGDLHESFMEQISEHWESIVEAVKKWESDNFKQQTEFVTRIENNRIAAGLV